MSASKDEKWVITRPYGYTKEFVASVNRKELDDFSNKTEGWKKPKRVKTTTQ